MLGDALYAFVVFLRIFSVLTKSMHVAIDDV